jgi:hypothetical protein
MINYSVPTRPDGAHAGSAAEWAAEAAQHTLQEAADALEDMQSSGADESALSAALARVGAAEEAVEASMDALLDLAAGGGGGGGSDGGWGSHDGDEDEEGDIGSEERGEGYFNTDGTFRDQRSAGTAVGCTAAGSGRLASGDPLLVADDFDDNTEAAQAAKSAAGVAGKGTVPQNFSAVDLRVSPAEVESQFPGFSSLSRATVTVTPGRILYLPAGWFHEVRSQGVAQGGHLAVNYWFHPPSGSAFDSPYADGYWAHKYNSRRPEVQHGSKRSRKQ